MSKFINYPDIFSKASEQEREFCHEIIVGALGMGVLQYTTPQFEFRDSSGKARRVDFAIVTQHSRIAVELDGYSYHAEGVVSREKHADDLQRQNDLIIAGWRVLRFAWSKFKTDPEQCRDDIRRMVVADPDLHPSFTSKEIKPHVIQREALDALAVTRSAGKTRGLVVLATGLGKTFLAAMDAKQVGGRVLFIVHNNFILDQAKTAFDKIMPTASKGMLHGSEKELLSDIIFANIATLRNPAWLNKLAPNAFRYIVIDEVHHSATEHYRRVINYFTPDFLLGLTATPNRTDGLSVLKIFHNNLVYSQTQHDAITRGFLTPFRYYAFKDNVDYSAIRHNGVRYDINDLDRSLIVDGRDDKIIEKVREFGALGKMIGFCVSIRHAERATQNFAASGIPAAAIHSQIPRDRQRELVGDFRSGRIKAVFVRDIFNEGIDFPEVNTLVFMRPTESKTVFIQQLGRGLRIFPGKGHVNVLDFIGNYLHADRIPEYLGEYGFDFELQDLRTKPELFFNNGCEIVFEKELVETLTSVTDLIPSDLTITRDFSRIITEIGRCPTLYEFQGMANVRIPDIIERYRSWELFVKRLEMLFPEMDLSLMHLPAGWTDENVDEYADLIVANEVEWAAKIEELCEASMDFERALEGFTKMSPPDRRKKNFMSFCAATEQLSERLGEMSLILSLRLGSQCLGENADESPVSNEESRERIVKAFRRLSDCKEAYLIADNIVALIPRVILLREHLVSRCQAVDNSKWIEKAYFFLRRPSRSLAQLREWLGKFRREIG